MTDSTFLSYVFLLVLIAWAPYFFRKIRRPYFILLINCLAFYWFNKIFLILILAQSIGIFLICKKDRIQSNFILWIGILISLGPLVVSKVYNIFPSAHSMNLSLLGISFYSLQIFGYLMDVRWQRVEPVHSFQNLFSYFSFFGNFLSGPLERTKFFLNQLSQPFLLNQLYFVEGLHYIYLGLFKKFVLAENLSAYTRSVFAHPENYTGAPALIAILLSKFYLYYDLSGYSDIFVGISKLYGIELTRNFNRPLFSTNISDFWKRWHISVSSWIRDYIFFPLLSTRLIQLGVGFILFVSFVLFGLWHGINWNFILYGALQASFLIVAIYLHKIRTTSYQSTFFIAVKWFLFYTLVLSIPSALFFSKSLGDFIYIMKAPFLTGGVELNKFLKSSRVNLPMLIGFIAIFEYFTWRLFKTNWASWFLSRSYVAKHFIILGAILVFLALAKINTQMQFVYWDF